MSIFPRRPGKVRPLLALAGFTAAMVITALILTLVPGEAANQAIGPFSALAGWWGGKGRLQFKDGKLEQVECRATYFVSDDGQELKQTIRCASGSGKIEVVSNVKHDAGKLAGKWTETVYNLAGDLEGEVTPKGFRVTVKGGDLGLSANMDIIVRDNKQIIEIQFFSETLIGLSLLLQKG